MLFLGDLHKNKRAGKKKNSAEEYSNWRIYIDIYQTMEGNPGIYNVTKT